MGMFILLVMLQTRIEEGGLAVTNAEFDNKLSCERAASEVNEKLKTITISVKTICVAK